MPVLGAAVIQLGLNNSGFIAGLAASSRAMRGFDADAGLLKNAQMGFLAVGAGAAIAGVIAVKMAADFQQGVNRLRTGAGDTQDSFASLEAGILGVSTATGQMTGPLTTAMYSILSSGQRGAQAFSTLTAAAQGAVIEQANVADVANTLSGVMTNFGTNTFGASQYMSGLITAVKSGKITLQDLATSMGPISPIAHQIGVSFSDLAAAMSTQTNAMIPADRAATGLRFMMQSLEVPTTKARNAMAAMGLDSVKVAEEMKVSLPTALQMIYNAAKRAGPEGSVPFNRAVSDMVGGQRSLSTFTALTGQNMSAFILRAKDIAGSMKTGTGAVDGWATAQSNFNVQLDRGKAVVAAIFIEVGTKLLPVLTPLIGKIVDGVSAFGKWALSGHAVSDVMKFIHEHAQLMVPILAGAAAIIGGVLVLAFISLAGAALSAAVAVVAATWPLLAIGAAVAGLVAIFMHFYQTNSGFKAFIDNLVVGFKQVASYVVANFIPAMKQIGTFFMNTILPVLQQIGAFLLSTFAPVWQQLVSVWQGSILPSLKQLWAALQPLMPVLQAIGAIVGTVLVIAFGLLVGILRGVIQAVAVVVSDLISAIGGIIQIFTGIVQVISGIMRLIFDIITGNWSNIGADLQTIGQGFVNIVGGLFQTIGSIIHGIFGGIVAFVSGFVQGVVGFFQWLADTLVGHSIIPDMINAIKNFFTGMVTFVINLVTGWVHSIIGFVLNLKAQAVARFYELQALIQQIWNHLVQWVENLVLGWVNRIIGFILNLKAQVTARFFELQSLVQQVWNRLVGNVISTIQQLPGRLFSIMGQVKDTVLGALNNLAGLVISAGANIVKGIANGILGGIGSFLGNAMSAVGTFIHDHLPHSPAKLGPLRDLPLQSAMISQQIAAGIIAGSPKIQAAMSQALHPLALSMGTIGVSGTGSSVGISSTSSASGGTREIHIHMEMNGRELSHAMVNDMGDALVKHIRVRTGMRS